MRKPTHQLQSNQRFATAGRVLDARASATIVVTVGQSAYIRRDPGQCAK